ncbi:MAG: ABC transporter substrate-binding protein [Thermomicrobiales bacterium]|nr:ABC transporter substrate-binding protein [Thermomicrobiales bacterium]
MSTRRSFVASSLAVAAVPLATRAQSATPAADLLPEIVIDLSGEPDNLTPALSYSTRDWSVMHSIYDSLVDFAPDGQILPQAAEVFESDDAITFRVRLRAGMIFHDGSPVTTAAITRNVEHIKSADSQISDLYQVITEVRQIDDLNAEIVCVEPSPWLPSQLVVWGVLLPEGFTDESLASAPIGSGPYILESWEQGSAITLVRNPDYHLGSPKGDPLAERVTYRFVPEAATRVADLTTGLAHLIDAVPKDQLGAVADGGNVAVSSPVLATAFIRIATDAAPFDEPRVCQAVNHAVDVQAIADALVSTEAKRLASVFPDARGLGFDASLSPFAYDPEKAKELLAEAGYADGFVTEAQITATSRTDVLEAVAEQLAAVGIKVNIVTSELATFNQDWSNTDAPALRYASWRPMYDPFTFVNLLVNSEGYLSRYSNPTADELIRSAAIEPATESRDAIYQELGRTLQDQPGFIYLWNLVTNVGVSSQIEGWSPRGDDYVLALRRTQ